MTGTPTKMDILAITETSENNDTGFMTNIEIEGYENYHTPSNSSKGGTAIYVSKKFDTFKRCDISISKVEFEITWI